MMDVKRNLSTMLNFDDSGYDSPSLCDSFQKENNINITPSKHPPEPGDVFSPLTESPVASVNKSPAGKPLSSLNFGKDAVKYIMCSVARKSPRLSPEEKRLMMESLSSEKNDCRLEEKRTHARRLFFGGDINDQKSFIPSMNLSPKKVAAKFNYISDKTKSQLFKFNLVASPQKNKKKNPINADESIILQKECTEKPGSKVGLKKFDLFSELMMLELATSLLPYFSVSDLANSARVSKTWNKFVEPELCSRKRMEFNLENLSSEQSQNCEITSRRNSIISSCDDLKENARKALKVSILHNVDAAVAPSVHSVGERSSSSLDIRSSGEERVVKCPSCTKPAVVLPVKDEGVCQNEKCRYRFCALCDDRYHGSNPCRIKVAVTDDIFIHKSKPVSNSVRICSKKSKANLRRL